MKKDHYLYNILKPKAGDADGNDTIPVLLFS